MKILKIEHDLIPVVVEMELTGVKIDQKLLEQTKSSLLILQDEYCNEIQSFSKEKININSNEQISALLFETLSITPKDKNVGKNGSYTVNKAHLAKLEGEHPIISSLLKYRKATALLKFCNQLSNTHPKTGRIHTNFNQIGTETGRFSSSKPNLQNIPNQELEENEKDQLKILGSNFRKVFIPKKGCQFIGADYSQVELRVMTEYSQDPYLLKAYINEIDIHNLTASKVFGINFSEVTKVQRKAAKSINFGLIYGSTAYGLADSLTQKTGEEHSKEDAEKVMTTYFERFSGVKDCLDNLVQQADERGHSTTLYGRKRPLPKLQSNNTKERESGKRMAMNSPIQGTAADIIKIAMIKCDKAIKESNLKSKMVLQVHDELLFEVPNDEIQQMETLVKECMENAVKLSIPLEVDLKTGKNWAEVH